MCELFGFDVTPPGTPEEPAAAPAPAPPPPAPDGGRGVGRGGPVRPRAAGPAARRRTTRRFTARARGPSRRRARARAGQGPARRRAAGRARGDGLGLRRGVRRGLRLRARSYLKPVGPTPTPAAEPGAARRAKAFADFEAEARARYLEEFSRLTTTDDVIGYAWPKPELGPDGLPLPLASRGGAATAPVPERTADEAGAAGVARPAARARGDAAARARGEAPGGLPHRPLVPPRPLDAVHRQDQAPAAAAARPVRAAPLRRHGRRRLALRALVPRRDEREPPGRVGRRGRLRAGYRA